MQFLTVGTRRVQSLVFSPDSQSLVVGSNDCPPLLLRLGAIDTGLSLSQTRRRNSSGIVFSSDSRYVNWISNYSRHEYDCLTSTTVASPDAASVMHQTICGVSGTLVNETYQFGTGYTLRGFTRSASGELLEKWSIGPAERWCRWLTACTQSEYVYSWEVLGNLGVSELVRRSTETGAISNTTSPKAEYAHGCTAIPDGSGCVLFQGSSLYHWQVGHDVEKIRVGTLKHFLSLAIHPNNRYLLAANNDATVRVIDISTWRVINQFAWKIGPLTAVAVSPDGQLAAAGSKRGQVVIWDLDL